VAGWKGNEPYRRAKDRKNFTSDVAAGSQNMWFEAGLAHFL